MGENSDSANQIRSASEIFFFFPEDPGVGGALKREEWFFPGASSGVGSEASTGTYKGILNFISYETGGEKNRV